MSAFWNREEWDDDDFDDDDDKWTDAQDRHEEMLDAHEDPDEDPQEIYADEPVPVDIAGASGLHGVDPDDFDGPDDGDGPDDDDPWSAPYGPDGPADDMDEEESHRNLHALSSEWMDGGREEWGDPLYPPDEDDLPDPPDEAEDEDDLATHIEAMRSKYGESWGDPPDEAFDEGEYGAVSDPDEESGWRYGRRYVYRHPDLDDEELEEMYPDENERDNVAREARGLDTIDYDQDDDDDGDDDDSPGFFGRIRRFFGGGGSDDDSDDDFDMDEIHSAGSDPRGFDRDVELETSLPDDDDDDDIMSREEFDASDFHHEGDDDGEVPDASLADEANETTIEVNEKELEERDHDDFKGDENDEDTGETGPINQL